MVHYMVFYIQPRCQVQAFGDGSVSARRYDRGQRRPLKRSAGPVPVTHSFVARVVQTLAVTVVGAALALLVIAAAAVTANAPRGSARSILPRIGERPSIALPAVAPFPTAVAASGDPQPVTVMIVASPSQATAVQQALDQAAPLLVTSGATSPRTVYVVLSPDTATPAITAGGGLAAQPVDLRGSGH
jgi:hypothetical protein